MPKRKSHRRQIRSSSPSRKPLMPFSLILQPDEMGVLRQIAGKEGSSMGAVIRRAIHTVIARVHPEFWARLLDAEANAFLDQLATRFPATLLTAQKRKRFSLQLAKGLK